MYVVKFTVIGNPTWNPMGLNGW